MQELMLGGLLGLQLVLEGLEGELRVEKRRKELQQSQPFHIILHAVFAKAGGVEYRVHQALAEFRVDGAGREWFQVSLERILTEIGKCLDKKLVGEALEQFEHVEPA